MPQPATQGPAQRLGRGGRAFALVELVAALLIGVLIAAVLLPALERTRRLGRLGDDMAKLRRFGVVTAAYGVDNADVYWGFSWKKGIAYSPYPDLNNASTDLQAHANQAVHILRTRAGREDILPIPAWLSDIFYSHLVLAEYENRRLPDLDAVSSEDSYRLLWARDPAGFDAGIYQPSPAGGTNATKRWPYSASFQLPPAFFDGSSVGMRLAQAGTHTSYIVPNGTLGGRPIADTAFPAHKVQLHDGGARHFGPRTGYCTHDEARLPLLFCDGSVSVRAAADANPGWGPNIPSSPDPTTYTYTPAPWEPPTYSGEPSEQVIGRFRWTRGGTFGRDYGGPEICTGQPGCQ